MNIIFYEWKRNWKSALKVALFCGIILLVSLPFTPFFSEGDFVPQMREALDMIPSFVMSFFGFYEGQDFTSHAQYLGFVHRFVFLVSGVFAAWLGGQFVAKERWEQTMDFLLSKPLKRWQIMLFKILANVLILLTVILLYRIFMAAIFKLYDIFGLTLEMDAFPMAKMLFAMFTIQLFFFALGCLLSMVIPHGNLSIATSVGIALLFYLFEVADKSGSGLGVFSILSPFHHLQAEKIVTSPGGAIVGFILVSLLLCGGSYAIFHNFDYRLKEPY